MAEVLKEWLTQRLQRPIKWEAEEFGEKMKNGHIIACVLRSYHVINDEKLYYIRSSDNLDEIKTNWKLLREWLHNIDLNLTDADLSNIMEGRGSTLLRLFYQLFLHLDKKDRTDFIKKERQMVSKLVDKLDHRFKVDRVIEEKEPFVDDLSRPLLNEKMFIEWQRKKELQIKDTYDFMKHKYSKLIQSLKDKEINVKNKHGRSTKDAAVKDKIDMEKFSLRYPCKFQNYTYDQLLELETRFAERKKSLVDTEWVSNYLDNLHTRMHKKADSEEFQKQLRNVISGSLWDMSVAEEESKLDMQFAKKVMKLSQFEKQMGTTIMETRQQARNLAKNRIIGDAEFVDQRTMQFNQFLDNVKEEINLGLTEMDFEKQRQNMLHKKLFAEKMKRKRQHYYEICYETILSIIDYATKFAYFKRLLDDDIPDHFIHEWKALYYKQQPIFDVLDPMEDILKQSPFEEDLPEEEEIVRLELDRQEALNENDFLEYHNYQYPWKLEILIPNYDPESEERKYEYLGARVLGHLVYTLLEIKYPYPPQRPPADLPPFTSKALVCGIPDRSITLAMQTLLNAKKIHVVRLEAAINFCLRKFKTEMVGCTDIELSFDKFLLVAQEEESKELIKSLKAEDDIIVKNSEAIMSAISGPMPPNVKQTQTPKTIPEEEIKLSAAADLGQYTYNALCGGDSLTDYLISAMIVEYIKDLEDINGFVIINYPNSYREAQILEETFSGIAPPDEGDLHDRDDIFLEESIIKHRKVEKDPYKQVRVSKLVSDPHQKRIEKPFESYFTCYLKLKETEDILQQIVIWELTEDNSDFMDRFYAALGLNYSMYYEVIEKEQLALICKYIIGDLTLPLKSSENLFGENVLSMLDFPSSDDKRTKSKIVKSEVLDGKSKERIRRGSKMSKSSIIMSDLEVVKAPDSRIEIGEDKTISLENINEESEAISMKSSVGIEEIKVLPGEEDWVYGEIPIAEGIGIALATCWEEVEKTYIHDIQQLFLAIRLQMNCLVPYTRFIKDKMEQIITLPSGKQDLVSAFQKEYNEFENDWRDVNLTKNEWHCRVKELQIRLNLICDERKIFAEKQRQSLICENWAFEELTTMVNSYISCIQAELNRSILTFQAFHDFYFAMIKRLPPTDRLSSKELSKINKESEETSGSKRGGEDKVFRQLKNAFQELQLKNIEIDFSNNPFNMIIENNVKLALKIVKDTNDSYRSLVSREYSEIAKIISVTKKKEENLSSESINEEEIFKQNALKCIDEWTMAINGEMFRVNLRILVLQYKCFKDMKLFNDNIYKAFTDIQININNYYLNEIKSVDRLCKYLQMAVESGKKIPESLLLENDTFLIDPNLLQFSPPETIGDCEKSPKDLQIETRFKISQLSRLRSQFKIVAPKGLALQQAFIYVLQDFIIFGKENCEGPMFPDSWRQIDPEKVPKLVHILFGETAYVDWRDFLIYCLNVGFPSTDELLIFRKKLRCKDPNSTELISRNDFVSEKLWFEYYVDADDESTQLRNHLIKQFIFELYETNEDLMNYSAFLLAISRNVNPVEGFAMALSMSVGKKICFSWDEGEEVICKLIRDKMYKDACLACALKCTTQFLDTVLTNVINTCEGTTLIELEYTEPPPTEDKKGKKGKGAGIKAKKIESSQSARLPKSQKSLMSRSKIVQSATDVKMTFICRPCQEEAEIVEDKPPEKEEVIEEEKIEIRPDPNLIYAVSQEVIWNVLKICLPWYFDLMPEKKVMPYVEQVTEVMSRLESDTENKSIYIAKFVLEPNICKILHKTRKFFAINLDDEIKKIII